MSISCAILNGRDRQCKNTVGGCKTLFLGLHSDFLAGVETGGTYQEVDVLPTATLYKFEVDPASSSMSLVSEITASPENGTVFYVHTITAKFKKITALDRRNFQNIAASQLAAFVLDNNGNIFYVGKVNGADVTGGQNMATGLAYGDMSGFNLTIVANEPEAPNMLESYNDVPFDNFPGITVSPAYPVVS